jgi:hypothetical protein
LRTIDLPEERYDVIYSAFVLEHISGATRVLERFVRWLKPGGLIILRIPDRDSVHGFVTRRTPFWLHVLYHRLVWGQKNAGKPGYEPYPTVDDRVISRRGIREFAHGHDLTIREELGHGSYSNGPLLFRTAIPIIAKMMSLVTSGRLHSEFTNLTYVLEKGQEPGRKRKRHTTIFATGIRNQDMTYQSEDEEMTVTLCLAPDAPARTEQPFAGGRDLGRPAISVVSPFHNRRDWLPAYLDMLEEQTLKDFEVIIVDDGSDDGLAGAVSESRTSFPLRCIRLTKKRGAGAARNIGIDQARGRYVALLDSDDAWHPEKLERDFQRFEAAKDRLWLVGLSRHVVIGPRTFIRPRRVMTRTDRVGAYLFQRDGIIQTSTMFLSTDLAKAARFAEGEAGHDDWTFALRLEAAGAEFEMVAEALTYYRDDDRPDRRSPRGTRISLDWLERYRDALGEGAYLAARAAFGSRMRKEAPGASLSMIATALWRGAVPAWRSAYYLGAWACPDVRTVGVYIRQSWPWSGCRESWSPPSPTQWQR